MPLTPEEIRSTVREAYGRVATTRSSCCAPSCCDGEPSDLRQHARSLGYADADIDLAPEDANLGLGCGNPTALAALQPGEVVLDLGSGAGFDAFQAAAKVGETGRVIGVDMTPEMLALARKNAVEAGLADRVDFREGAIEALPVVDDSVDVVLSNCVINLSPDKPKVFAEAFRALKPGGRLHVSDILLTEALPAEVRDSVAAYMACVGGAMLADDYLGALAAAGFTDLKFTRVPAGGMLEASASDPVTRAMLEEFGLDRARALADTVYSYKIEARKP